MNKRKIILVLLILGLVVINIVPGSMGMKKVKLEPRFNHCICGWECIEPVNMYKDCARVCENDDTEPLNCNKSENKKELTSYRSRQRRRRKLNNPTQDDTRARF